MHALREALTAFRRAPLLTGLSAAMVALALFVVGLFALAAYNLQIALRAVEERVEVVAYVRDDAQRAEIRVLEEELARLSEVLDVRFVSKGQALNDAREELPEFGEIFTDLEVNPLPASLEVRLQPESRTPEGVERVAEVAGSYPFVEEVRYGREWVDKLFLLRRIGGMTAVVLGGAFAAVAALIIGTAVRIAIFARRDEIYVMRLVGAKDGFIRRPFLLEGAFTGLSGGVLAVLLTWAAYLVVSRRVFQLEWIPGPWVGLGIVGGILFGILASGFAVRRHLREV